MLLRPLARSEVAAIFAILKAAGHDESWIDGLIGAAVIGIVVAGWDLLATRNRATSPLA